MNRKQNKSKIKAFLQVSRANLLLASIGHPAIGLFLGASVLSDLLTWEVPLYVLLHYCIAFFACNLNCICDYDVDRHYKKYMSDNVDVIGKRFLKIIIILEFLLSIFIISFFYLNGYLIVSILGLIALFVVYSYSAEPFRIKKHGILSPLPILVLYTIPMLCGWLIFKNYITFYFFIFIIGYVLMQEGFTLVNTCEDYNEDKKENIRTWAHRFGLKNTLRTSFVFSITGILCIIGLVLKYLIKYDYNIYFDIISIVNIIFIFITLLLILKASFEVRETYLGDNLEKRAKKYGKRLQKWFIMTRYPLMICAIIMLL